MRIIKEPQQLKEIWAARESGFEELIKFVVDIEKEIVAIDAEMHADLETMLLETGSDQSDLWGGNLYPEKENDAYIEFTSFINIRPANGNRAMEVKDAAIREKITEIIKRLILR